jgi:hypothetical protein
MSAITSPERSKSYNLKFYALPEPPYRGIIVVGFFKISLKFAFRDSDTISSVSGEPPMIRFAVSRKFFEYYFL